MADLLNLLLLAGGALAAILVSVMCGVCLVVWLSGGERFPSREAWRSADES